MTEKIGFIMLCILMFFLVLIIIGLMILLYHEFRNELSKLKECNTKKINKGKLKKIKDIIDSYEQGEPYEYTVLRINNIKDIFSK